MYDMRAPDGRTGYNRSGRTFEEELNLRYLSPGAFTVLSPEESGSPPDPPTAPPQYRLSPNANVRRNKNQSFAIIAEPANYEPSRSPSPTSGRVSPFRGRGFNPTGSRHASPAPSPPSPPQDNRLSCHPTNDNINNRKRSHIPQLKRHNSSMALSTEESTDSSPRHVRRSGSLLRPQLSRSLNNIGPRVSNKPPAAPGGRRHGGLYSRHSSFSRLSPIIGSSPEPSTDSKSSPSRIPMSRSSPSSRKHSPENDRSRHASATNLSTKPSGAAASRGRSRAGSQAASRNASRNPSRNHSREPSPSGKPPISPSKIPSTNYRNVQAKVNSFNAKSKTKVPNTTNTSSLHSTSNNNNRLKPADKNKSKTSSNSKLNRTDSISSVNKSSSFAKRNTKKPGNSNGSSGTGTGNEGKDKTAGDAAKSPERKALKKTPSTRSLTKTGAESDSSSGATTGSATSPTKKSEPLPMITEMLPPATVLSTTTDTVTKPLKIEATIDTPLKTSHAATNILAMPVRETPMYMDEDAETLLKDHSMSKPSPAATAIISLSSEQPPRQSATGARTMPSVETTATTTPSYGGGDGGARATTGSNGQSANAGAVMASNGGQAKPGNPIGQLVSPADSFGARARYENSDAPARPVLPQAVQPIKIVVQERGQNMEVQSGNVRFPPTATNGTAQGAGAPPHIGDEEEPPEEAPSSRCGRFMRKFKQKTPCCKRNKDLQLEADKDSAKQGCFACLKKKKKMHDVEEIIISSADEVEGAKKSFLEKLKCCSCRRSNKVGDSTTGCCGLGKKKEKWTERRDSILSAPVPLTRGQRCKNFFKLLFCCCCGCAGCTCCKKTPPPPKIDDAASRRASLLSKKKSLTPTVIPQEDPKNKLDSSLVEYTSTMKAAIPVLPVALAYICLFFNIFAPGTGTVFSGLFCLCMGKPRFSQRDDPKSRLGSFIINAFIGAGQLFTVLFCLVGWGWSIWWGVIMIKVAKKYRKIKLLEKRMEAQQEKEAGGRSKEGSQKRDVEKGRS